MNREPHRAGVLVLGALVLVLAGAVPGRAEEVGFALLIEDGVKFQQGAEASASPRSARAGPCG